MTTDTETAKSQAQAQVECIVEMMEAHAIAVENSDTEAEEVAQEAIYNNPLSVEIRGSWYSPGADKPEPEEFCLLLCTGGPAVRIIGTLHQSLCPDCVHIEYQDWGTPWTRLNTLATVEEKAVLEFCGHFYFGE